MCDSVQTTLEQEWDIMSSSQGSLDYGNQARRNQSLLGLLNMAESQQCLNP